MPVVCTEVPRSRNATGALLLLVAADVHETLAKPEAGLHPAVLIAATAGIEADVPVEPVMVVMVAVVMAVMAFSAVLASQSSAGSKQNKSGGDTKSGLTEHRYSPVTQPVRHQSRRLRKGFTGNKSACFRSHSVPQMDEGAARRPGVCQRACQGAYLA
jgi:hypothetical protein